MTSLGSTDARVAEIEQKLRTEYSLLDGANKMLPRLEDRNAREQCEANIRETSKRIDYLEGEKARLLGTVPKPSLVQTMPPRLSSSASSSTSSLFNDSSSGQSSPQQQSTGKKFLGGLFSTFGRNKDKSSTSSSPGQTGSQPYPAQLTSSGSSTSLGAPSNMPSRQNSGLISGAATPNPALSGAMGPGAGEPTHFGYWLLDSPLSSNKIKHKLREIKYKLDVEQRVKAGTEKMLQTLQLETKLTDEGKQRIVDVQEKLAESSGKVVCLQKALQKYQGLWVGPQEELWADVVDDSKSPGFSQSDGTPTPPAPLFPTTSSTSLRGGPQTPARRPLIGKLRVTIMEAQDLPFRKSLSTEVFASVSVDNAMKATTKSNKAPKWNETMVMDLERAGEAEITVVEKDSPQSTPLCVAWFRLSDLDDELKMRASYLLRTGGIGTGQVTMDTDVAGAVAPDADAMQRAGQALQQLERDGFDSWLEMEPSGKLLVRLNFTNEEPTKKEKDPAKSATGGLQRSRPVRKLFYKRGHKFEPKSFYGIMRCATCGDWLMSGSGYQCVQCKYTCHKQCQEKVLAKCITKSEGERDEEDEGGAAAAAILKHNIPHRFEATSVLSPQWCTHCGYMLPLGKKQVMRCTECKDPPVVCHEGCMPLIPNLCGMSMEVAFSMMEAINQAERRKQERSKEVRPIAPIQEERLSMDEQREMTPSPEEEFVQEPPRRVSHPPPAPQQQTLPRPQPAPGAPAPAAGVPAPASPIPQLSISELPPAPVVPLIPPAPARGSSLPSDIAPSPVGPPELSISLATLDRTKIASGVPAELPPVARPGSETKVGGASVAPSAQAAAVAATAAAPAAAATSTPKESRSRSKKPAVGLDDFHFLAVLGKGNFGKVMLAEEKLTGNLYAIKVLKKDFIIKNDEVESVKSEKRVFQTANMARHPFLVGLHSCFQTETRVYFVMEYVSGGDLMWHIQQHQFSEKRAKFYACEVLLALEYFHQNNVVYRDLKLDNILLTTSGHIKLADYGLCKENMGYGSATNTFCGTPEFMAPEILMEKPYGRAVDWWAFGVLIYEMLLGQSPFKGEDEDEIFEAILEDEIIYPANMNRDAVSILQKLLTKDPSKRLGAGRGDAEDVKRHPFFKGVDWDAFLRLDVPPPYTPRVGSSTDISNFDEEFTRLKPVLTLTNSVLHPADQEEFRGFTYVSEWAQENRAKAIAEGRTKATTPSTVVTRQR